MSPRITIEVWKCERCEHIWMPRAKTTIPKVCPKCKSPYWNEPRKNEAKQNHL